VLDTPRTVVVDSGPIIAFFDADDAHHQRGLEFLRQTRAQLISTMAAVTEAMHVLADSLRARKNLLVWIQSGGLHLTEPTLDDFARIAELIEKYADLPMDFTDAVVVALCERLNVRHVATVDRDFAIYRHKGKTKFVNVFLEPR
jgi:predicted nucleic acid-binding protein